MIIRVIRGKNNEYRRAAAMNSYKKIMMDAFNALIFDMDGTLIDNMVFHERAWMLFLEQKGIQMSKEEFEAKHYGTIDEVVPRIFGPGLSAEEIRQLGAEKEALYREIYQPHIREIEGLSHFLEHLRKQNYPLALATMGDRNNVRFTLDNLGIRSFFDAIISGEDVKEGKPEPEIFFIAASRLEADPLHCLVFEDSRSGVEAAHRAGMQTVALATTHSKSDWKEYELYDVIDHYLELDRRVF